MKKSINLLTSVVMSAVLLAPASAFAASGYAVKINGEAINFSSPIINESGRLLMPINGAFDKLGAKVNFDEKNDNIVIDEKYSSIELTVGSKTAYIHKKYDFTGIPLKVELEVAPKEESNTVYVPLRFTAESLGATVSWDEKVNTAVIEKKNVTAPIQSNIQYKIITTEDIKDNSKLVDWVNENSKTAGIHYIRNDETTVYALVCAGEKNTGGYSVTVNNVVSNKPDEAYIYAQLNAPGPDAIVTQAITYPYVLVRIDDANIKHVSGDISGQTSTGKTILSLGAAISCENVKSAELFSLTGEKLKDLDKQDIKTICDSFNNGIIDDNAHIEMLAGNSISIVLDNGNKIAFTSYGSKTNVIATVTAHETTASYHLVCPEIANILLSQIK